MIILVSKYLTSTTGEKAATATQIAPISLFLVSFWSGIDECVYAQCWTTATVGRPTKNLPAMRNSLERFDILLPANSLEKNPEGERTKSVGGTFALAVRSFHRPSLIFFTTRRT